jgi:hypothetical protein
MTDDDAAAMISLLPPAKRLELLTAAIFEDRRFTLSISRTWLGMLTEMSKLVSDHARTTLADQLRDAADIIELPLLLAAE